MLREIPSRLKRRTGHVLIELSLLSVLYVVISVFCLDVGFVVLGSQMNDAACRDGARAAAQGNDYLTSLRLAQAAVAGHRSDGYFVAQPKLEAASFVYEDFSGNPPPATSPFVVVTTSTNVRIPAPVFFIGAKFGENGTLRFSKTYRFPIVRTALYL